MDRVIVSMIIMTSAIAIYFVAIAEDSIQYCEPVWVYNSSQCTIWCLIYPN